MLLAPEPNLLALGLLTAQTFARCCKPLLLTYRLTHLLKFLLSHMLELLLFSRPLCRVADS